MLRISSVVLLAALFFLPGVLSAEMWVEGDFEKVWKDSTKPTGKYYVEPITGMRFILIKGGCFTMGSAAGNVSADSDEKPEHQVCLNDFYLSIFEVTNDQFGTFKTNHRSGNFKGVSLNSSDRPAVNITWNEAREFTRWLTKKNGNQFRLPTEAEWEYAAKAAGGGDFFWGEDEKKICEYANIADISVKKRLKLDWETSGCNDGYPVTAPVGRFKENTHGLYDMLGNVQEWVSDRYAENYYRISVKDNPVGPAGGDYRVARGGDWSSKTKGARTTYRGRYKQNHEAQNLGFRLAISR